MGNVLEFFVKMKDMMSSGLVKIAATSDKSFSKVQSMVDRTIGHLDRLKSKVNEVDATANKSSFFSGGMFKKLALIGALTAGVGMAVAYGKESYTKALQHTGLTNAINTTTGGKGNEAMAQTKSIADKYGINYEASLEGVKTLTGGLMSMNMPLKEQMKIFEGVSTGVAALGLTADESKGAMLALGQMASKGTVSAEELRGQLGERIPGAFGLAAKAMNVTEAQLNSMLMKGEIAASDFLPKLAAQMQKTFGADALKNATGPQAIQNRFDNAMHMMQVTIGQGLMPLITPLISMFTNLANSVLPYITSGLSQIVGFIGSITSGTSEWSVWFDMIKQYALVVWDGLSHVFAVVWKIVSGVVQWMAKSTLIQDIFWGISKVAGVVWAAIKKVADAIGWIWDNLISPILNSIESAYNWAKSFLKISGPELVITKNVNTNTKLMGAGTLPNNSSFSPSNISSSSSSAAAATNSVGSNAVSSGITGSGPRNITINIGKLVERLEIHSSNLNNGLDEIETKVTEVLLRVLNSGAAVQ